MLIDILRSSGSIPEKLMTLILMVVTVLFSLTVHEVAHGYVAYKCGDPTARNLGRLSLDPRKHLDPIGTIAMLIIGVGWAKPVPVNSRYFRHPKRDMALTAAAGPASNFIMAFFATFFYLIFFKMYAVMMVDGKTGFALNAVYILAIFFSTFYQLNLSLAIFNLIPIPPFDGSRLAFVFLPTKYYFAIMKYERYIMIALLLLLCSGFSFGLISTITGFFSNLFIRFWTLLPFLG